ncbi:XdhC family protein [Marinobacter sp. NP-4(2019)]|uniref:XdhC family protein n=1 Tax=Marinobacter sp. NP-4(2019) TaxID=2488665 RepID=UPI0013E0D17E|nr:XdhC family protein [Marinobacter sp. NP-4(2019)]
MFPQITSDPLSVLEYLTTAWATHSSCALVILVEVEGPASRSPGTLLAVRDDGEYVGSLSNGCLESDVVSQALEAMKADQIRHIRYGAGSDYLDIQLPCGGAVTLLIIPNPSLSWLDKAITCLQSRKSFTLDIRDILPEHEDLTEPYPRIQYQPRLKLAICGRGTEPVALAHMAHASGFEVEMYLPGVEEVAQLTAQGIAAQVISPGSFDGAFLDNRTAFVAMFHDHDYEIPILDKALASRAFYIGAMGSHRTHEARLSALLNLGHSATDLDRIRGPIGLVGPMKDPHRLAISVLAEILSEEGPQIQVA